MTRSMQRDDARPLHAGGFIIFLGFLIGTAVGIAVGEPSHGVIIGVACASALALLLYLVRRDRT